MNFHLLIMAAGSGSRFGAATPKQFLDLDGKPVVVHAIQRLSAPLLAAGSVDVTVVISPSELPRWKQIASDWSLQSVRVAFGGATRWESVRNALQTITPEAAPDDIVLVHDGARPLVEPATVLAVVDALADQEVDGAIPVTPMTDSLRMLQEDNGDSRAVDRARFVAVQTPQAFRAGQIAQAYLLDYRDSFTDDASVMAAAGLGRMKLVAGSPSAMKITHPLDLKIARIYLDK